MQVMRCFNAIFEMAARIVVDVVPVQTMVGVPSLRAGHAQVSRVWVRPTVSFANRLTAPEIRLVWLPRGWLSPGPHTFCDLDQDLVYLCFFLVYGPRPRLQDRSLNPPKKTWIYGSMLSSDLVDPDLLSVSRHTANLVPAVANPTVQSHSLPTFVHPQITSRQCE